MGRQSIYNLLRHKMAHGDSDEHLSPLSLSVSLCLLSDRPSLSLYRNRGLENVVNLVWYRGVFLRGWVWM